MELPFSFFLFSFSLPSQESVATDEGFHDESTNDTDPLVKKGRKRESELDVYPPTRLARKPGEKCSSAKRCWRLAPGTRVDPVGLLG